jgi:hypothetical protein
LDMKFSLAATSLAGLALASTSEVRE